MLAVVGCTRDNPAFGEGGSESSAGTDTDAPTDSEESGEESGEGGLDPACEPMRGPGGLINVVQSCTPNTDDGLYDHWLYIIGAEDSEWRVQVCVEPNCGDCKERTDAPLTIEPLDLAALAGPMTCIHVKARRLPTQNVSSCEYHSIVVEADVNGVPVPLVMARTAEGVELPPVAMGSELAGFEPAPVEVASDCPCDEFPQACCEGDGREPTTYAWDIDTATVPVGMQAPIWFGDREFEFWALDASDPGVCDVPRNMAWAVYAAL